MNNEKALEALKDIKETNAQLLREKYHSFSKPEIERIINSDDRFDVVRYALSRPTIEDAVKIVEYVKSKSVSFVSHMNACYGKTRFWGTTIAKEHINVLDEVLSALKARLSK